MIVQTLKFQKQKGFTLLEILLVVGIIAILAGIVIVAINPARQLAQVRNTERKSDIKQIKNALEQYYIDHNRYPTSTPATLTEVCDTGTDTYPTDADACTSLNLVDLSILVPTYIVSIPKDPQGSISFLDNLVSKAYAAVTGGAGYKVMKDQTNKIVLTANKAEYGAVIAIGTTTVATAVTTPEEPEPETCTSFDYTAWSECVDSTKTRTVTASYPEGCTGGTPDLSDSCVMPDVTAPTVTAFAIPATASALEVTITTFTATDAIGVTGYKLTESDTPPSSGAAGWTGSAPATYTFSTEGAKTLYAWAKDAEGNVSTSLSDSVTIALPCTATGGDSIVYTDADGLNPVASPDGNSHYKVHKFTTVGSSDFVVTSGTCSADYLMIAGGGGGGTGGGGGGAGGVIYNPSATFALGNYNLTIGAGGGTGTSGSDSVFNGYTAVGGGKGGPNSGARAGTAGGSGGGGGYGGYAGGNGTAGQGYAGGTSGGGYRYGSAGGGGASHAGYADPSAYVGGNGGEGVQYSIAGVATWYAGGGGGGLNANGSAGESVGGSGVGGNGGKTTIGYNGATNTGSGGGGGGYSSTAKAGGAGANGIVIVRYAI